jgi:hypothetical protein
MIKISILLTTLLFLFSCSTSQINEKNNINLSAKKSTKNYKICNAKIISNNEDFSSDDEKDMKMNILCSMLNEKNFKNFNIVIDSEQSINASSILDYDNLKKLKSFSVLEKPFGNNLLCFSYTTTASKKIPSSEQYICFDKEDKKDNTIEQCYLKGIISKKSGRKKLLPETLVCPNKESYYQFGREILPLDIEENRNNDNVA